MQLRSHKNIKYFQSELFKENNFVHGFLTKRYENNEPQELQKELYLTSNIHFLHQVHSNKVIQINNTLDLKPNIADCLIAKERFQSLWIYTADCMPILIADIKTRHIAACHSGLNGLKKKIISKIIKKFLKIGSNKKNLIIAIGPSITGDNYQVKEKDIKDLIIEIKGKDYKYKSRNLIEFNKEGVIPLYRKDETNDRLLFDIQAAAILQLNKEGIKNSQININRICTYSNPKLLNSFRRDNTKQRQWSFIYS